MTAAILLFFGFVLAVIIVQIKLRRETLEDAKTLPLGTVKTYVYEGNSGPLREKCSNLQMENHVNMMVEYGWEVVNQTGLSGHIRLGRTLTGAALTGGLSLYLGGSRTADRVSITYRRASAVRQISGVERHSEPSPQNNEALQNVQGSTPILASSMLMDELKEELFQLEVERGQGRISEEEYQGTKSTLTHILGRTLESQTIAGTASTNKVPGFRD